MVAPRRSAAACAPGASSGAISSSSRASSASNANALDEAALGRGTSPSTGTSTHVVRSRSALEAEPGSAGSAGSALPKSSASSFATRSVSRSASVCRVARPKGAKSSSAVGTGGRLDPSPSATFCCARARDRTNAVAGADAAASASSETEAPTYRAVSRSRISCTGPPAGSNARRNASRAPEESFVCFSMFFSFPTVSSREGDFPVAAPVIAE